MSIVYIFTLKFRCIFILYINKTKSQIKLITHSMKKKFISLHTKVMFAVALVIVVAMCVLLLLYLHFKKPFFIDYISIELVFMIASFGFLLALFVLWFQIRRHVTRPISILISALKTGDIASLDKINSETIDDEWDRLVDIIRNNFKHVDMLKEQADVLKEQIAIKNKFFDIIAHDLRAPFNAILGFSSVLLEENDYSEEDKKQFLGYISQSATNTTKLLDNLLAWARLQTGRLLPNLKSFDINQIIKLVYSLHQTIALQHKVHLILDAKKTFIVKADENMIETVLRNLVSNAIKFTQANGFVTISTKQVDNELIVSVVDNGKGIKSEDTAYLFDTDKNFVSEDVSGDKGTGLGLILSKEMIEKNGGRIWVESELGKGSQFYFTIPMA